MDEQGFVYIPYWPLMRRAGDDAWTSFTMAKVEKFSRYLGRNGYGYAIPIIGPDGALTIRIAKLRAIDPEYLEIALLEFLLELKYA